MNYKDADEVKQLAKRSKKEELENKFLATWVRLFPNLAPPVRQYKFHPDRRWRWDFAFADDDVLLAIEIQGGAFVGGRHITAGGQAKDYEKHNAATALGWRCLYYSTPMLKDMEAVVQEVAEILCNAKPLE